MNDAKKASEAIKLMEEDVAARKDLIMTDFDFDLEGW